MSRIRSFGLGAALVCLVAGLASANFVAYNDCVYDAAKGQTINANATTYNIGNNSPGPSSGLLKNIATGANTSVTAALSQTGNPVWQPGDDPSPWATGGTNCDAGTDANNTFGGIVDVKGVTYYGSTGWYVDLTLSGLDPAKTYTFATTANRNGSTYSARLTTFTLSGADAFTNASTAGTTMAGASTTFCTGINTATGYVARWTGINPGSDGTVKIRAEAGSSEYRAYAFSVFQLVEVPEPATLSLLALGGLALLRRRR